MKYTLKFTDINDPLRLPWDIVVENTKYPSILTVQDPHPESGANLIGFEVEPQECGIFVRHGNNWHHEAIGKHPVFAAKGGIFSLRGIVVSEVIEG